MRALISGFTPGLMSRTTLEALFVARQSVLETIMRAIESAANGQGLNQTLIVAPRGAGKSHLIALVFYRIKDLIASGARIQLAWLPEDPWRITNYASFLATVLAKLDLSQQQAPQQEQTPWSFTGSFTQANPDELEGQLIHRAKQGGPIVVLVENLDQILARLGELGQQRLRHLLQASQSVLLVASSTRLDRNLSDQARPFYGFFTTLGLPPLTDDQASALLLAVAGLQGDSVDPERFLDPRVLARIKAIGRLTGGQPRTWIGLADLMILDDLDRLVAELIVRLDDLSPYYQERLAKLSIQQRQIVVELASTDQALHVAELATRIGSEQRSVGRSITDLVDLGWVTGVNSQFSTWLDRRRTYYELVDPMVKVAFQLKEFQGSTLPALVWALSIWFEPAPCSGSESWLRTIQSSEDESGPAETEKRTSKWVVKSVLSRLDEVDLALESLFRAAATRYLALPCALRLAIEESFTSLDQSQAQIESLRTELHLKVLTRLDLTQEDEVQGWIARAERQVETSPSSMTWREILVCWLLSSHRPAEAELAAVPLWDEMLSPELVELSSMVVFEYLHCGTPDRALDLAKRNQILAERGFGADHLATRMAAKTLQEVLAYMDAR